MFNLFQKISINGLGIISTCREQITPLEWAELAIAYPQLEDSVPWDAFDGEAWMALLAEEPRYARHIRWEKISKSRRRAIQRLFPDLKIPSTPALAGLDKLPPCIQKNPPFPGECFSTVNPRTGVTIGACIYLRSFLKTLEEGDHYDTFPFVCGCGEPGCSGFRVESLHKTQRLIHWSIQQYEVEHDLYFDRDAYEKSAIKMLAQLDGKSHFLRGRDMTAGFRNHAEFAKSFRALLQSSPRLQGHYASLNTISPVTISN